MLTYILQNTQQVISVVRIARSTGADFTIEQNAGTWIVRISISEYYAMAA